MSATVTHQWLSFSGEYGALIEIFCPKYTEAWFTTAFKDQGCSVVVFSINATLWIQWTLWRFSIAYFGRFLSITSHRNYQKRLKRWLLNVRSGEFIAEMVSQTEFWRKVLKGSQFFILIPLHFVQCFYNYGNAALYTPSDRNLTDSAFITVHVLTSRWNSLLALCYL